MLTYN